MIAAAVLAAQQRVFRGALCSPRWRHILRLSMKPQDLYRDWRIIAGLALVMLGAGNWAVGLHKTQQANRMIAQTHVRPGSDYRSFDEVDAAAPVLKPFTHEEERVSYATARMDF